MNVVGYGSPVLQSCQQHGGGWKKSFRFGLVTGLCVISAGCIGLKVKQPPTDTTPPTLTWNVLNQGNRQQADYSGNATIKAKRGESYRITLKAKDPEGVKSIQINPAIGSGESVWQCTTPPGSGENFAQSQHGTHAPMSQDLAPDSQGMVLTSIFLITNLSFNMECQPGLNFVSGAANLTGRASNYFGGTITDVLKFTVSP